MESKPSTAEGEPLADNRNTTPSAAPIQGRWLPEKLGLLEKFAPFGHGVIPERRLPAKGAGVYGTFSVTQIITRRKLFSEHGGHTAVFFLRDPRNARNHWQSRTGLPRALHHVIAVMKERGIPPDVRNMERDGWQHG